MIYFSNFPQTLYQVAPATYRQPAQYVALTDITRNVRFKTDVLDKIVVYNQYILGDGEKIENVSESLYGSPYYHWVLMLFNNRFDYLNDFPMSSRVFDQHIDEKYNKIVNGNVYLLNTYGYTPHNLPVDYVDSNGYSVDYTGSIRLINKSTGEVTFRNVMSVWYYDSTLKIQFKRFIYMDNLGGKYVDTNQYRIDYGQLEPLSVVNAYQRDYDANENKRPLKVLSERVLQLALQNFKDLM